MQSTDIPCEDGRVHLVGGDDVSRGRVEYCYEGSWFSVCADSWDEKGAEAQVICQSLGYNTSQLGSVTVVFNKVLTNLLIISFSCD